MKRDDNFDFMRYAADLLNDALDRAFGLTPRQEAMLRIRKVIFNDPATIVFWSDGTKTIVKAENEPYDPEKGLAMAISKYFFDNKGYYYDIFKEWLPEDYKKDIPDDTIEEKKETETVYMTVKEFSHKIGISESTVRKWIHNGKIFGAKKSDNGKWMIPVGEC